MIEIAHPSLPGPGPLYCGGLPAEPFPHSVARLTGAGIRTVACLLEPHELPTALTEAYRVAGLALLRFPIPDRGVPRDRPAFGRFLEDLSARLRRGEGVYLHCLGGIGRTGTALACLLKMHGAQGDPIRLARAIYTPVAVESPAQQVFVAGFDPRG